MTLKAIFIKVKETARARIFRDTTSFKKEIILLIQAFNTWIRFFIKTSKTIFITRLTISLGIKVRYRAFLNTLFKIINRKKLKFRYF
jgi:hypothetical protein